MKEKSTLSWKEKLLAPAILATITAFVYSYSLHYAFQFDDTFNIRSHFDIRFNTFSKLAFKNIRWISYWINSIAHSIDGFNPFYYRLFNIIFHISSGILVFYIVLHLFSLLKSQPLLQENRFGIACLTSLFFLLHPVQTQTVTYIIQGQLEGVAVLSLMIVIFLFLQSNQHIGIQKYLLRTVLFGVGFFGCGSKEIFILAPVMLLLIDWFFIAQGTLKKLQKRVLFHASFFAMTFTTYMYYLKPHFFKDIIIGHTTVVNNIGNVITHNPATVITPWLYLISQFKVTLHYIGIFLWPFNMTADYDWKINESFFDAESFFPFLVLLCIGIFIARRLRKDKIDTLSFCFLWFFIGLAPRSTFIPSTELLADYKTYFSSFGICLLFAIILTQLFVFIKNKISESEYPPAVHHPLIASTFLISFLGFSTYERNTVWETAELFWADVLVHSPHKARAHNNYGTAIAIKGDHQKAAFHFKKATNLDKFYPDPWNNLAVTYDKLGNVDRAINTMNEALKIHTDYPEFYSNLGAFYITKKEYEKVEPLCKQAIKLRPHYGKAYYNIGRAKFEQHKYEEAWQALHTAIFKADYDLPLGYEAFAVCSMKLQKFDAAIDGFSHYLQANPSAPHAFFNLGNAYYCNNDLENAEKAYTHALALAPDDHKIYYNLGEIYIKRNNPEKALSYFGKALPLAAHVPIIKQRFDECKAMITEVRA